MAKLTIKQQRFADGWLSLIFEQKLGVTFRQNCRKVRGFFQNNTMSEVVESTSLDCIPKLESEFTKQHD